MKTGGDLIESYFKILNKIWTNTLGCGFWIAVIAYFVFKVSFDVILTIALALIFIMLPLTVASFAVVLVVSLFSLDALAIALCGFIGVVGIILTRLSCIPLVGFGEKASPVAGALTQITIALAVVTLAVVLILFVVCAKQKWKYILKKYISESKRIDAKLHIFHLNEVLVLITVAFAVAASFPIAWLLDVGDDISRYIIVLSIIIIALLGLTALIKAISCKTKIAHINSAYRKLTKHILETLHEEIEMTMDEIRSSCSKTFGTRYEYLISHILTCALSEKVLFIKKQKNQEVFSINTSQIEEKFLKLTSIKNKKDLIILAIATIIHTSKTLFEPEIAKKLGYGEGFDPDKRLKHDDKSIKKRCKGIGPEKLADQTPVPYDIVAGSAKNGKGMSGKDHRLKTLGHDPFLGWIFGILNILTDTITYNDLKTYRISRTGKQPEITSEYVILPIMIIEAIEVIKSDKLNLPAAFWAQAKHLASDAYTKMGLPVPVLGTFDEKFAGKLYKEHYDALCLARDVKIIATSESITHLLNCTISLLHGLFYNLEDYEDSEESDSSRDAYEVRTRKIIDISNSVASCASILKTVITRDLRDLDIGGILANITQLCVDFKFITKIKKEYIERKCGKFLDDGSKKIVSILTEPSLL